MLPSETKTRLDTIHQCIKHVTSIHLWNVTITGLKDDICIFPDWEYVFSFFNPLKHIGVRRLHFEVFSAIQV